MRVHPDVFAQLETSAKRRKIPIAEDAVNRLQQSFHWDKTVGDTNKLLDDAQQVIAGGKEAALRQWGIVPVGGRDGLYVDAGKINPQEMIALNPALETLIERVVIRTLENAKRSSEGGNQ